MCACAWALLVTRKDEILPFETIETELGVAPLNEINQA